MPIIDRNFPSDRLREERRHSSKVLVLAMILIAVLVLGATAGLIGQIGNSKEPLPSETPVGVPARIAYTTHVPIYIDSNTGFTNESGVVWGSGTESDPYIIEGWDISASTANGIEIRNTDAHFIVRICYLYDGRSDYHSGIELVGCVNGTLDSNTCWNNSNGIYLHSSGSCMLINNTCSWNYAYGIDVALSDGNTIRDNTCLDNWDSIHLYSSSNNNLSGNLCSSNHDHSLYLDSSNNNTLNNNTCMSNGESGVYLYSSNGNNIAGNQIRDSRTYGIFIDSDSYDKIWNNTCSNNSAGMYLRYSNNNTLVNNTCLNNEYGIQLNYTNSSSLSGNNCSSNKVCGINLISSCGNNLTDNNCSLNEGSGIVVTSAKFPPDPSGNNRLVNNTCSSNNLSGIGLSFSDRNDLINNNCSSNDYDGISLFLSSTNMLTNNNCSSNGYNGISLFSSNNTLTNNTCSSNYYVGIGLSLASDNTLISNNCSNDFIGISLNWSSNKNEMSRNLVCNNARYGVFILSDNNRIWDNTFIGNNGATDTYDASHVQAYDDGTHNWWNSTDGCGNYWSDWTSPDANMDGIVDVPYDIAGSVGAKDYYPLTTAPEPIPEFSMMPFVLMVLLVLIPLAREARLKNT